MHDYGACQQQQPIKQTQTPDANFLSLPFS
jgi:hypothetical protein